MDNDPVSNPAHYQGDNGLEAIEVIEAFFPNNYHLGNAFKYLARAGKKDPEKLDEDLEKAIWYIQRFMDTQIRYSITDKGRAIAELEAAGIYVPKADRVAYESTDGYRWHLNDRGVWESWEGDEATTEMVIKWIHTYGTRIVGVDG